MIFRPAVALAVTLLTLFLFVQPANAAGRKVPEQIAAIDRKNGSITVYEAPGALTKYSITSETRVLINGQLATFRRLNTRMKVTVTHAPDSTAAHLIVAHTLVRPRHRH